MATSVTYTSDGSTVNYAVPFPYLATSHVEVYVDSVEKAAGADYDWVTSSTIRFRTAPTDDAEIVIRRATPHNDRLVVFTNGAVLPEDDLNTSALQLFYLLQEQIDRFEALINGTYVELDQTIIESVAEQILGSAAAAELAARVSDIAEAGELLIDNLMQRRVLGEVNDDWTGFKLDTGTVFLKETGITLEEQFNTIESDTLVLAQDIALLGARNGAGTAFILDVDTVLVSTGPDVSMAQRFTALVAADSSNSAAIVSEATTRATADTALSSSITTLSATVTTQGSTITTHTGQITTLQSVDASIQGDIAVIEANWGVAINVDGHITGINLMNDGDTGEFVILADEFYIVDPANDLDIPQTVFAVVGGVVFMQNAYVSGDLFVGGTITGQDFVFDTTTIEIPDDGYIHSVTTWNGSAFSGIGWWIGTDTTDPKFFIGDPSGSYIKFDDELTISHPPVFLNAFSSNDDAGAELVRSDTDAGSSVLNTNFVQTHEFTVSGTGTIAVRVEATRNDAGHTFISLGQVRLKKNGSIVGSAQDITDTGAVEVSWTDIDVDSLDDVFTIEASSGQEFVEPSGPLIQAPTTVSWVSARANIILGTFS